MTEQDVSQEAIRLANRLHLFSERVNAVGLRVHVAGGFLRDILCGVTPNDIDMYISTFPACNVWSHDTKNMIEESFGVPAHYLTGNTYYPTAFRMWEFCVEGQVMQVMEYEQPISKILCEIDCNASQVGLRLEHFVDLLTLPIERCLDTTLIASVSFKEEFLTTRKMMFRENTPLTYHKKMLQYAPMLGCEKKDMRVCVSNDPGLSMNVIDCWTLEELFNVRN